MPLYFDYEYFSGGLGDWMRSLLSFYVHCQQNEIGFVLSVTRHPIGEYLADNKKDVMESEVNIRLIDVVTPSKFLQRLKMEPSTNFRLVSNAWGWIPIEEMIPHLDEFRRLIRPTPEVAARLQQLIPNCPFVSIHLRCGDHYMKQIMCNGDCRLGFGYANKLLHREVKRELAGDNRPIYLHCDSLKIRIHLANKLNLQQLPISPHHTALPCRDPNNHLESLLEFYLIGQASSLIIVTSSGFAYWSYFIYTGKIIQSLQTLALTQVITPIITPT